MLLHEDAVGVVPFPDRADAGVQLGARLAMTGRSDLVVLGMLRGGVPVALAVAAALAAPLDVLVVQKLVTTGAVLGALGEGDVRVLHAPTLRESAITIRELSVLVESERAELEHRAVLLRKLCPRTPLVGRTALIVDDGIVTGSTVRAACRVVRDQGATRVVVAVPVAPLALVESLRDVADEVVALVTPLSCGPLSDYYVDFTQPSVAQVMQFVSAARVRLDVA